MSTDSFPEIIKDDRFPYYTYGIVVKGFGRGSKKLGIPTGENLFFNNYNKTNVLALFVLTKNAIVLICSIICIQKF